jgi:hypothetical protein
MPDDPIKAALEAAALAVMNDAERHHAQVWHEGKPGPGAMAEAARAVATFLRALPDWHEVPPGRSVSAAYLRALAAAVEEAARDE